MIALFNYSKYNLIMESSFKFKGYDFLYFDEGVPYYSLFRSTRKLNSFWEIKYVAEVLYYLNPSLDEKMFVALMMELSDRSSGHVIRTYSSDKIRNQCSYIYNHPSIPYVKRYRKLIFNPNKMIPTDEKMSIVGKIIGSMKRRSKLSEEKLYETIELLSERPYKITYASIAEELQCARQTVSHHITASIKDIINYHNTHYLV